MSKRTNWIALAMAGCLFLAMGAGVSVAITEDEAATSPQDGEGSATTQQPALDGAKVYAWNCGSCHSERRPKEHSDAEWDVIMTHMRVRANMTAEQAKAVLQYLQENN